MAPKVPRGWSRAMVCRLADSRISCSARQTGWHQAHYEADATPLKYRLKLYPQGARPPGARWQLHAEPV